MKVAVFLLMALPGYIFVKVGKIKREHTQPLVLILMYVCQPFLTIQSFQVAYEKAYLVNFLWIALFALLSLLALTGLYALIYRKTQSDRGVYVFGAVFSNCGFMGIPVISALFPGNAVLIMYVAVYLSVFNILTWTIGTYLITGDRQYIRVRKAILNPSTISLAVALPLFLCGLNLQAPEMGALANSLYDGIAMLGEMTAPLSMLIMGMTLASMPMREIFTGKGVYVATFLKLIIAPLFMYCVLLPFALPAEVEGVLVLLMAMPSATACVSFCNMYGANDLTASKIVLMSTLLCVLTIPFVSFLL